MSGVGQQNEAYTMYTTALKTVINYCTVHYIIGADGINQVDVIVFVFVSRRARLEEDCSELGILPCSGIITAQDDSAADV